MAAWASSRTRGRTRGCPCACTRGLTLYTMPAWLRVAHKQHVFLPTLCGTSYVTRVPQCIGAHRCACAMRTGKRCSLDGYSPRLLCLLLPCFQPLCFLTVNRLKAPPLPLFLQELPPPPTSISLSSSYSVSFPFSFPYSFLTLLLPIPHHPLFPIS